MRVAVTGAAGFVGSAIVRELVRAGHRVIAIDNLSTGKIGNLEGVECDWFKMDAAEADYSHADAVIHAAAYPDISANWERAEERERTWRDGPDLTRRVLGRIEDRRRPFVFLSTCAVYGGGACDENSPTRATSPYAASKLAGEALVQAWDEAGRIDGTILRMVSAVGPRYAHGHIVDFVRKALADDGTVGCIRALDNGRHRKSFVHVQDVAETAVAYALGRGSASLTIAGGNIIKGVNIVNVTSDQVWGWSDTAAMMQIMRPDLPFTVVSKDSDKGWTGDPVGLHVRSLYWDVPRRSVAVGVREALEGLGWKKR